MTGQNDPKRVCFKPGTHETKSRCLRKFNSVSMAFSMAYVVARSPINCHFPVLPVHEDYIRCYRCESSREQRYCRKSHSDSPWTELSSRFGRATNIARRSCSSGTISQNISRGHQKASSFKLVFKQTLKLSIICSTVQHDGVEGNFAATRRRRMKAKLNAGSRTAPSIAVSNKAFFWRGSEGWVRPCLAINVKNHAAHIHHRGTVKFANLHTVQIVLESRSKETDETS